MCVALSGEQDGQVSLVAKGPILAPVQRFPMLTPCNEATARWASVSSDQSSTAWSVAGRCLFGVLEDARQVRAAVPAGLCGPRGAHRY